MLIWCLACCVNVLLAPAAPAQDGRLEIAGTAEGPRKLAQTL